MRWLRPHHPSYWSPKLAPLCRTPFAFGAVVESAGVAVAVAVVAVAAAGYTAQALKPEYPQVTTTAETVDLAAFPPLHIETWTRLAEMATESMGWIASLHSRQSMIVAKPQVVMETVSHQVRATVVASLETGCEWLGP